MKATSFYHPYDTVFRRLQSVLRKEQYVISSASSIQGRIKAKSKSNILQGSKIIDIKIVRLDEHETGVSLSISSDSAEGQAPLSLHEMEETILLTETIHNHF